MILAEMNAVLNNEEEYMDNLKVTRMVPSSVDTAVDIRAYGPFTKAPVRSRSKIFHLKQESLTGLPLIADTGQRELTRDW